MYSRNYVWGNLEITSGVQKFEVYVIDIWWFVDTSIIQKIVFHEFCDEYYSKLLGRVLGGLFWPHSREYLSHAVPEQYRQPGTLTEAVSAVVPADSGTADAGTSG